jgi:peptidoglycan/LPS O-acetylase OafA/YrhL
MVSYHDRKDLTAGKFYLARAARVLPMYLIALALTALFVYGDPGHNLTGLLLSATFLQSWVYPYALSFNDPAWSVSVEISFYVLFPFLLFLIRRSKITPERFLLIATGFYLVTQVILIYLVNAPFYQGFPSFLHDMIFFFPLPHLCGFLLGLAGGMIYLKYQDRVMGPSLKSYALVIGAFIVTILAIYFSDKLNVDTYTGPAGVLLLPTRASLHALLYTGLILSIAFSDNGITRAMSIRPLAILGASSYSIYILQRPLSLFFRFAVKRFHLTASLTTGFLITTVTLVIISLLAYFFVEPAGKKLIFKIDADIRNLVAKIHPRKTTS